jgi:autotransporter-associated beta strand protein
MKPSFKLRLFLAGFTAAALSSQATRADAIFWDGSGSAWDAVGSWDTDNMGTGGNPVAVPGASDIASFCTDVVTGDQTVNLNANQSALGLDFIPTPAPYNVTLLGGGVDRTLTLGASGIWMQDVSPGNVIIGSVTAGQKVAITLDAPQSWTNDFTGQTLTIHNAITNGTKDLTIDGASNTIINGLLGGGSGGLTKSGAGTLTLNAASTYTGPTIVTGGTLSLTKTGEYDDNMGGSPSIDVNAGTLRNANNFHYLYIGTATGAHSLKIENGGKLNNFKGLHLGTSASSDGNTALFTGAGTVIECTPRNPAPSGGNNLHVGAAGSNNSLTVSGGAIFNMPKGGGTNSIQVGVSSGADFNSITVTGAGSRLDASGTNTSNLPGGSNPLYVGNAGSNNSLTVSAGGFAYSQRLFMGAGGGSNNSVTITGNNSKYNILSGTNAVFETGIISGADGNTMTVSNGGAFNFSGSSNSRTFAIGKVGNNNSLAVTGTGSAMNVSFSVLPMTIGGLVSYIGNPAALAITDGGSGNHLDISNGGRMTSNTSLYLMGTNSAFNLGNGTAISVAKVGNASGFTAGVYLKNEDARLNINSGRWIAAADGLMASGAGKVQLNGPAYVSTNFNSSISSVIAGSGGLTKEGSGSLTLSAANLYGGATVVTGGTLVADTTTTPTVLSSSSALTLGGSSTFKLFGALDESRIQTLNGLTVNPGANTVDVDNQGGITTTLDLGSSITRAPGGTVDFKASTGTYGVETQAKTTQANGASGILGAWATVSDGADLATRNGSNQIVAYTGYTDLQALGPVELPDDTTKNYRTIAGGTSGPVPVSGATTNINTLTHNVTTDSTIDTLGGTLRVGTSGGVLISKIGGPLTIGTDNVDRGVLSAGGSADNVAGDLVLGNFSASSLTINSVVANNGSGAVSVTKTGVGDVYLYAANTYSGGTFANAGILYCGTDNALGSGPVTVSGGTLAMQGFSDTVGAVTITSGSITGAGGTLTSTGGFTLNIDGATNITAHLAGSVGLTKSGAGIATLEESGSYSGDTTVAAGTLSVLYATLDDASVVTIASGALLELASGEEDTVDKLFLNGVQMPAGTYGSTSSAATTKDNRYFSSTGTLNVLTGAPAVIADLYDNWADSNGLDGTPGKDPAFDIDSEGDGLANGLEWILGGDPLANDTPSVLPAATGNSVTGLTLTFTREEDSIGIADLAIDWGSSLDGSWTAEVPITQAGGSYPNGVVVSVNQAATPDAVTVTIPAANAVNGKLFARFKSIKP